MKASSGRRTTILLIDDHALFRKGIAQLLAMDSEFMMVGEASSGREGLPLAEKLRPDIILIDLNMKDMNGIETLKALKSAGIESRLIMLTVSDNEEDVVTALRAGANGYLLKDMEPEEFCATLKKAAKGMMVLGDALTESLAHALITDIGPGNVEQADLTEREREILDYLSAGMSNKAIAREMGISDSTVKVHIKHLLRKLKLRSRLEAAVWVHEHSSK
jgi:two-component system nitrate/nitrite response regulator NarL